MLSHTLWILIIITIEFYVFLGCSLIKETTRPVGNLSSLLDFENFYISFKILGDKSD